LSEYHPVEFDASRMEQLGQIFLMANDQLFDPMHRQVLTHELLRLILEFLPISRPTCSRVRC